MVVDELVELLPTKKSVIDACALSMSSIAAAEGMKVCLSALCEDAIARVQSQAQKIQDLKNQLRSRPGWQDALQRAQLAQVEARKCRESNEALKAEIASVKASLEKAKMVAVEANGKIDNANERIRTLRKERDEALKEGDRLRAGGERLLSRQEECRRERQDLSEQKEALLRIVEDLHQTCKAAGMTNAGRHSIKDIGDLTASYRLA